MVSHPSSANLVKHLATSACTCLFVCCCSALHFVAAIGNAKCVKLLIDAGADINLQDKEGESVGQSPRPMGQQ